MERLASSPTAAPYPPTRCDPRSPVSLLRALPRAWDDLPIWAQLNITWRCNLDCHYCTEYDNSKGHVPFSALQERIEAIQRLGTLHTDLIGGEPLLHPDLASLMREVTQRGMTTGMTTNGFLLTEHRLDELVAAGLGRLQISVDAVTPSRAVPKSLKTLRQKIEMAARYPLWLRVNTVLSQQTVDEVEEIAAACFELAVPINFSLVHSRGQLLHSGDNQGLLAELAWLESHKQQGHPISTPHYLIDYFRRALRGQPLDWTCQAGRKCFYVSPDGDFHFCYHVPAVGALATITRESLAGHGKKKGCEEGCGVHCVVQTSLPYSNPSRVALIELAGRVRGWAQR